MAVAFLPAATGLAVVATGAGLFVLWMRRTRVAKALAKRVFGVDIDIQHLKIRVRRKPLRLLVEAAELTLYTPPGSAGDDVALKLPQATALLTKLGGDEARRAGHTWALEVDLQDMQVHYVYVSLEETNFDKIIKQVLAEKMHEVPEDQCTSGMRELARPERGGAAQEEQGSSLVVTRVSLAGRSRVLVRAGQVPLLPPVSLSSIDVDPELLRSPVGLLLFINALVLKALQAGGYDLVHLVASNAARAGLAVAGSSAAAVRSLVSGGSLALRCTSRSVERAAGAAVQAGEAAVTGTWAGANEMAKYTGTALVEAGGAARTAGGAVIGAVGEAGRLAGGVGAAVGSKALEGTGSVARGVTRSTGAAIEGAGSFASGITRSAIEGAGSAAQEVTRSTGAALEGAGSAASGITRSAIEGAGSAVKQVTRSTGAAIEGAGAALAKGGASAGKATAGALDDAGHSVGGAVGAVRDGVGEVGRLAGEMGSAFWQGASGLLWGTSGSEALQGDEAQREPARM